MPITTRQISKIAKVSEQTVRNYTHDYGELLSPQARGETGPRLFTDEDVRIFCSIANLRKEGIPPAEVIERVRRGDIYIEVEGPQQATPSPTQTTSAALDGPQAIMIVRGELQRQINELRANQKLLLRAAVLWGALWGAVAALAFAAFLVWVLWLLART